MHRIVIIGIGGGNRDYLGAAHEQQIVTADVLVGGARHLALFPEATGERWTITGVIQRLAEDIRGARDDGKRVVVLASGDPLWYGIGASLRRFFAAEELMIMPAPTSYQLAFAALGEPWHDAVVVSAHHRPLDAVIEDICQAPKAAILTDPQQTPALIAEALLHRGCALTVRCAICENLGHPSERIIETTLGCALGQAFAPLNIFIVWCAEEVELQNLR